METEITIYIVSDSIGETGELIARAAVRQFIPDNFEIKRFPFIKKETVLEIFEEASNVKSMVIYTTVSTEMKNLIDSKGKKHGVPTVDVMSDPMLRLEELMGFPPKRESGIIRRMDEDYFSKVEAVEFAVKYDDGKDTKGIVLSDICLVGVSRTSKTPLSMYLAHKNFKVANIPLVPEVEPPEELFKKDKKRVIGLIADVDKLNEIRLERLKTLGLDSTANYANIDRIKEELAYSQALMKRLDCLVIDVSGRAIEETAGIVVDYMTENFGQI